MTKKDQALLRAEARVFKALGHPTRLFMIQELSKGECCVCRFAEHIDADFSTVSRHLAVLKQAGLVEDEKRGQQVFYHLRVPCVMEFMSCIEAVLRSNAAASAELLR
jgi:DNA-binding transcriptional ArsR family regulator